MMMFARYGSSAGCATRGFGTGAARRDVRRVIDESPLKGRSPAISS